MPSIFETLKTATERERQMQSSQKLLRPAAAAFVHISPSPSRGSGQFDFLDEREKTEKKGVIVFFVSALPAWKSYSETR